MTSSLALAEKYAIRSLYTILAGHVTLGGFLSKILTPNVHERLIFELVWVPVTVTMVVYPMGKAGLDSCEYFKFRFPVEIALN